jgi:hypothetical protein
MKKILGLLLISSSIFSMELAYRLQTPYTHFNAMNPALVKADKPHDPCTIPNKPAISNVKKVLIEASSVRAPNRLIDVKLYHGKKGFIVLHEDKKHVIEKRFMDPVARNIKQEQLKSFLKMGYFAINQTNDGAFTLKANHRLLGGGPLWGKIMYWVTKVTCYTVLLAATGVMVTSGGNIGVSVIKGAKGIKSGITTAKTAKAAYTTASTVNNIKIATVMASSTAQGYLAYAGGIATQGTGAAATFSTAGTALGMATPCILASGIIEAGSAPTCAKVVGASLAAGHSGTGIVAGIEFISMTVGLACGLAPTP